jgi:hypothetical protein
MTYLIPLTTLIIGLIIAARILKKNTVVINKFDPENTQFLIDLRQKMIKK